MKTPGPKSLRGKWKASFGASYSNSLVHGGLVCGRDEERLEEAQ